MKTTIKNGAIVALSTLMLVGCSSTSNSPTSTSEVASSTSTEQETETVELTLDNWQDYLEIKEDYEYDYNDFDEITSMSKIYNFYLKDGMTFAEDSYPEVAIEVEYDVANYYTFSNVDWENGTFDLIELDDETKSYATDFFSVGHTSETDTLTRQYDSMTEEYTSNSLGSLPTTYWCSVYKDDNVETTTDMSLNDIHFMYKYENLTITRIKGTIEVVK